MPTKTEIRTGGDFDASDAMNVYVCTDTANGQKERQDAANGIEHALNQLLDRSYIPGFYMELWKTDASFTCNSCDILTQWDDYRAANNLTDNGSWIVIQDCDTSCAITTGDAWTADKNATVKTGHYAASVEVFQAVAVQEVFHNFIVDCLFVNDLKGPENEDHSLGDKEYADSIEVQTPMCVTYDGKAEVGDCNDDNPATNYLDGNTYLNSCEVNGMDYSREHVFDLH